MKNLAIAFALLACLPAAELRADQYDQVVKCSKNLDAGTGPKWQVMLENLNGQGRYVGTVYRNGIQLYGLQSRYLEMTRQGASSVWSSDLGTAYLSIDSDGFGTFTTSRYNYSVSRLNCQPVGVPESGGDVTEAALTMNHAGKTLKCHIGSAGNTNRRTVTVSDLYGGEQQGNISIQPFGVHEVSVVYDHGSEYDTQTRIVLKVDQLESTTYNVSEKNIFMLRGADFMLTCGFQN